jgi:replicative DNA helicase
MSAPEVEGGGSRKGAKTGGLLVTVDPTNEQVVLGALLNDAAALERELPGLDPTLFCSPGHRDLVEALRELRRRGAGYAADSVVEVSEGRVKLRYLRELEEGFAALAPENLRVHLERLRENAAKYAALDPFGELYDLLDDPRSSVAAVEEAALEVLRRLRGGRTDERVRLGKRLRDEWLASFRELRDRKADVFVPLHFTGLDEHLYEGLRPGRVVVLAARPGTGKSTFVANLLLRQRQRGNRVLCCPIEDGTDAVVERMVAVKTEIPAEKLVKTPDLVTDDELRRIDEAVQSLTKSSLLVFADAVTSLDELELLVEGRGFKIVVVDLFEYLLQGEIDAARVTQELRRLRQMAKRHGFCAIVVQQIRRIKRTKNPRPFLHELKNSGGYEEVADLVLLLHRDKYYDPDSVDEDLLEIQIAKQRRGPQNVTVYFKFHPEICRVGAHDDTREGAPVRKGKR